MIKKIKQQLKQLSKNELIELHEIIERRYALNLKIKGNK